MSVSINQGTQTAINATAVGGVQTQVVRLDVGSGTTASDFGGTITEVANLVKGTITALANGTIGAGTISTIGLKHADAFATVIVSGTSAFGTIKPAVSGSAIYVTDLIVSAGSATNVEIGSGGTSTPIVGTLLLAANGGAVMNFRTPIQTASGSALVYKQSADAPLTITALGYVD